MAAREARGARCGDPRAQKHAARVRAGQDRANLYEEITDEVIAELEGSRVPGVLPWGTAAAKAALAMPKNASTDRQYNGINVLILWGPSSSVASQDRAGSPFARRSRLAATSGGRTRHQRRLRRAVRAEQEKRRAAETGDEAQAIPFLKRFTGIQYRSVRRLARGDRNRCAAGAARPDRTDSRSPDQGERHRVSHWRQSRVRSLLQGKRLPELQRAA